MFLLLTQRNGAPVYINSDKILRIDTVYENSYQRGHFVEINLGDMIPKKIIGSDILVGPGIVIQVSEMPFNIVAEMTPS